MYVRTCICCVESWLTLLLEINFSLGKSDILSDGLTFLRQFFGVDLLS